MNLTFEFAVSQKHKLITFTTIALNNLGCLKQLLLWIIWAVKQLFNIHVLHHLIWHAKFNLPKTVAAVTWKWSYKINADPGYGLIFIKTSMDDCLPVVAGKRRFFLFSLKSTFWDLLFFVDEKLGNKHRGYGKIH